MRARSRLLCLVLGLGLGFGSSGCKRDKGSDALGFDPEAEAIVDHTEHRFEIALVSAGAEPREQLRYAAQAPSRTVTLRVFGFFGKALEEHSIADLAVSWSGLAPEGELRRYLYEVVEARTTKLEYGMDEFELRVFRKIANAFNAVAGQATGSATGLERVIQTRGELPTRPSPGGLIAILALPLPEQAIGVGAQWTKTAVYEQEVHGFRQLPSSDETKPPRAESVVETHVFTDVTRYTLVERSGDTLTVTYESSSVPDDPERATSSSSSGRFVVSLDDPLPRSGSLELTTRIAAPGISGGDYPIRTGVELGTR